ncbi:unnamed protein product [Sphagnum balticum]
MKKYFQDELARKSLNAVKLLCWIFVEHRCAHIWDNHEAEPWAFGEFFTTESYSYKTNMLGSSQRMVSRYSSYIAINVLETFVADVYQPIVCNLANGNTSNLSKQLYEAFVQHYFKDVCRLLGNAIKEEYLRRNYEHFRILVTNLYLREFESRRMSYGELVRTSGWMFMLELASWLRDMLLDLFLHGVKGANKQRPGIVQDLLDFLYECDKARLSEEIRDNLMLRLFDADNIKQVTPKDIRETLFNNPAQAKIYCRLALTTSMAEGVRDSLTFSLNTVKDEIEA